MNKFIRKILIFILPIVLFALGLELIVENIPNSYSYKSFYVKAHVKDIKTLIIGSSNAYDGISPKELPSCFNLANSGQALKEDYLLLSKYIDSMDSLETVILALGYHSLRSYDTPMRKLYYTIYMDIYPRWPLSQYSFELYYMQQAVRKIIEYAKSRDITRCDSLGQRSYYDGTKGIDGKRDMQIAFLAKNDSINIETHENIIDSCKRYLHLIDSTCNIHNVRFVVVQMPVLKEYKELLPCAQVQLQESILQEDKHSWIYIDASEWPLDPEQCYNATHITKDTSIPFTLFLKRKIKETTD